MGLPNRKALRSRQAGDGPLDVEDRVDAPHRLRREWGTGQLGQVEQLASPVRPAACLRDRARPAPGMVELAEPGICVRLQDPRIPSQMPLRVLAPAVRRVVEQRRGRG